MKSALVVLRSLNTNSKGIMALVLLFFRFPRFFFVTAPKIYLCTRSRMHTRTHVPTSKPF